MAGDSNKPGRRILVVDDEEVIRTLLQELLTPADYDVAAVATGREALDYLTSGEFGVAILDKNLPDITGIEVLRESRRIAPALKVILYTAYPSQESIIDALRAGAFDYLEKPASADLLVEKVNRAWEAYVLTIERNELMRRYETLFEIVPGIVWFMTQEGIVKRINREGAAMLGYGPHELLDRPYDMILGSTEPAASHWAFMERRTGDRATRRRTVQLRTRDGERRVFEISATGAYDRGITDPHKRLWGTLGVGWDITDRAELEEQLHQARRMEAIGRVAGAVAHDFNNYLSVIINGAQFLRQGLPDGDQKLEDIANIEAAANRAANLTRQLLAISRRQVTKMRPVNFTKLLADMGPLLERLIPEHIELQLEVAEDLGLVKADSAQLEQVVINLVANARDAMPEGGTLTIAVSNDDLNEEFADRHLGITAGPHLRLRVADIGSGMTDEAKHHIFDAFYTTKGPGKGTGLGMATVYGVVTRSGGCITVDSEENAGSTITVYLPHTTEEIPEEVLVRESTPRPGKGTVLVVEDETMVRQMAARILRQRGYGVIEAADGTEALNLVDGLDSPIDALLTDVVMPAMTGTELASLLRGRDPDLPVVYMSGYVGDEESQREVLGRNARVVEKPFTAESLLSPLQELLEGE